MLISPDVKLTFPQVISPGSNVRIRLHIQSQSNTPVDILEVSLVRIMTESDATERILVGRNVLGENFELTEGAHAYSTRFRLPSDARFSYEGVSFSVRYEIHVHVSIPWWPDVNDVYDITVVPPVPARSPASSTRVRHS